MTKVERMQAISGLRSGSRWPREGWLVSLVRSYDDRVYREPLEHTDDVRDEVFLSGQVAVAPSDLDALLMTLTVLPVVIFVGVLLRDPSNAPWVAASLPLSAASGGLVAARRRRRIRSMRIERRAGETFLGVGDKRLRFPLHLRGEQQTYKSSRLVFLQAVDEDGASILFMESRRKESGGQTDWFSNGIDKSLRPLAIDLRAGDYIRIVEVGEAIAKATAPPHRSDAPHASERELDPSRRPFVPPVQGSSGTKIAELSLDGRDYEVRASGSTAWVVSREPTRPSEARWIERFEEPGYVLVEATIAPHEGGISVTVHGEHARGGTYEAFSWRFARDGRRLA